MPNPSQIFTSPVPHLSRVTTASRHIPWDATTECPMQMKTQRYGQELESLPRSCNASHRQNNVDHAETRCAQADAFGIAKKTPCGHSAQSMPVLPSASQKVKQADAVASLPPSKTPRFCYQGIKRPCGPAIAIR